MFTGCLIAVTDCTALPCAVAVETDGRGREARVRAMEKVDENAHPSWGTDVLEVWVIAGSTQMKALLLLKWGVWQLDADLFQSFEVSPL